MNSLPNSALRKINILMSEIDMMYHEAAKKVNLSDSSMLILYMTYDSGGCRPLSDITATISKQTANSALRKLETEGLIYLEGKKKKIVFLTPEGENYAKETVGKIIEMENRIYESWTKEDTEKYIFLLEDYICKMKQEIKGF